MNLAMSISAAVKTAHDLNHSRTLSQKLAFTKLAKIQELVDKDQNESRNEQKKQHSVAKPKFTYSAGISSRLTDGSVFIYSAVS